MGTLGHIGIYKMMSVLDSLRELRVCWEPSYKGRTPTTIIWLSYGLIPGSVGYQNPRITKRYRNYRTDFQVGTGMCSVFVVLLWVEVQNLVGLETLWR